MKKIFLIGLSLMIACLVFADVYTIGEGTNAGNLLPYNGSFAYNWSKIILTKDEINAAGLQTASDLVGIAFYVSNTPSSVIMQDQRVYLRHTNLSAYAYATTNYPDPAETDLMFEGSLVYNGGGWHTIAFSQPFAWDGTQNIEFIFENRNGISLIDYPTFRFTSTSPNYRGCYRQLDASFPSGQNGLQSLNRPNIRLYTPEDVPPSATIAVLPQNNAIFVPTDTSFQWNPALGATAYKISIWTQNPTVYLENETDLGSDLSYSLETPLEAGREYFWQIKPYNSFGTASNCPVWTFGTEYATQISIGDGNANQYLPVNVFSDFSYTQSIYLQSEIDAPDMRIDKIYYYWNGRSAAPNSNQWTIYMGHTALDEFSSVSDWLPSNQLAQVFSGEIDLLQTPGWVELTLANPFYYNNTDNLVIAVNQTKESSDSPSGFFYNTNTPGINRSLYAYDYYNPINPENPPTNYYASLVQAYPNITMILSERPLGAELGVFPTSYEFPRTIINFSDTKVFTLANTGVEPLEISSLTLESTHFIIEQEPASYELAPQEFTSFAIKYAPAAVGSHSANLIIESNAPDVEVALSGQAYDPTAYLPWYEDFSAYNPGALPEGWARTHADWILSDSNEAGGMSPELKFSMGDGAYDNYRIITPPLYGEHESGYKLSFKQYINHFSTPYIWKLEISTDLENWTVLRQSEPTQIQGPETVFLNLPLEYIGTPFFLAWNLNGYQWGVRSLHIDDIQITEIPPNPSPVFDPAILDFGIMLADSVSQWKMLKITNIGAQVLDLAEADFSLSGRGADLFELDLSALPLSLENEEYVELPVRVRGDLDGILEVSLILHCEDVDYEAILLAEVIPGSMVQIGEENLSQYQPFSVYYGYERSAALYTAEEIVHLGYLDYLGWYCSNPYEANVPFKIYAGTTTATEIISQHWNDLTLILEGNRVFDTEGWHYFSLEEHIPVAEENLIIAIETNYGSVGAYASPQFGYSTGSENSHIYWSANNTPPSGNGTRNDRRPNLKLHLGSMGGELLPPELIYPTYGEEALPVQGFEMKFRNDLLSGAAPDYYVIYMSQNEEDLFDDHFFETRKITYNPVVEGGIEFGYSERWFWAVEAVGYETSVLSETFFFKTIANPPEISVNPLSFSEELEIGESSSQTLTISNNGGLPLHYSLYFESEDAEPDDRALQNPALQITEPGNTDRVPFSVANANSESRAAFDLQFYYPLSTGQYGIASDGTHIYTAHWEIAGAIRKYSLGGEIIAEFVIPDVPPLRDLSFDGRYFYATTASSQIYQLDFYEQSLVGIINTPLSNPRGIAYDSENDAFWLSNAWSDQCVLINRSGNSLRNLTLMGSSNAGLAFDNVSDSRPTLWGNVQISRSYNFITQYSLEDGSILQSFDAASIFAQMANGDFPAGGIDIVQGIVPGKATLLAACQSLTFYGLELCDVANWLSISPRSGIIEPDNSEDIEVMFNTQNIAAGLYNANIIVRHNGLGDELAIPVELSVSGEWPPAYSLSPESWDFAYTEEQNPLSKEFVIRNSGGPGLTFDVGDIYLTDDAEGNFALVLEDLPIELGFNESYRFSVVFTPQSLGLKTATLMINDNLNRQLHSYPISGTGIVEAVGEIIGLQAEIQNDNDVLLSWGISSNLPGFPGWMHYDSGINYGAIGTNQVDNLDIAIKFNSTDLAHYQGMQFVKVRFFPTSANTDYTIQIWTGNDNDLAPGELIYSLPVTNLNINSWNDIYISPFPISAGQVIWIGYNCDVHAGDYMYPAGCDQGPAVQGKGDLIRIGNEWVSLAASTQLNNNWNLQAFVNEPLNPSAQGKPLQIPVSHKSVLPNTGSHPELLAYAPHTAGQRVLRGFNVYRNGTQINSSLVQSPVYQDLALPDGTYEYTVQAVYHSTVSAMSEPVTVVLAAPVPLALPFIEDWSSYSLDTNMWTADSANWYIDGNMGSPAPSITFDYDPYAVNYFIPLTSFSLDGTDYDQIILSFDLTFVGYNANVSNTMSWEVWNGSEWNQVGSYASASGTTYWNHYEVDISEYAQNRIFKIRFVAAGQNSYQMYGWHLDNIKVAPYEPPPEYFELPFTEDWSSFSLDTNLWTADSANWRIDGGTGNPAPAITFDYDPRTTNYSIPLTSFPLNGMEYNQITLSFDLTFTEYNNNILNTMSWEVWDGEGWNPIGSYSSASGGVNWAHYEVDISEHARNRMFKIRFVAAGEDTWYMYGWHLDNIHVEGATGLSLDAVSDLSIRISDSNLILDWTAVENAQWYAIYSASSPYADFELIAITDEAGDYSLPLPLAENKAFFWVSAGSGEAPQLRAFSPAKR